MTRPLFAILAVLSIAAPQVHAQKTPQQTVASFQVSPGLEMSLWASEPMMVNPTCMDIDHKGRVWICESVNYRHKLRGEKIRRPEGDRILVLEDTKGAGKADKVTVFYQSPDTLAPLGIAVLPHTDGPGCTVYVCQSPDILVFEDKDGDGKADGPPRKLLSGFNGFDHDHGVHGINIGPDGKLYFTVGDTGVRNLADKFGKKWNSNGTDCRAGTCWRCDLDGKNLEFLAHNFRNHYEPCVDSFGTLWVSDNDDDGNQQTRICYVMPGGNYGYHHNPKVSHWNEEMPGIVPKVLRTYFGSPTGICFYEGTLLPKSYQGQLLHTDAGPRHVRCYHINTLGAGYSIDREDIVQSSDNWFRPSDVCVAPDGSVFIADWYDPGVGGHAVGDLKMGRVYRLAPTGNKQETVKVDLESNAGLTAALGSPNLSIRAAAMSKLWTIALPKALDVLTPMAHQTENAVLRARALWQMGKLGHLKFVNGAFEDSDPRFRILAMRILADMQNHYPVDFIPDWQKRLVKDPSPAVRREGLLLSRRSDPAKAADLILDLAEGYDGKDRFYLAAVGIAVGHFDPARQNAILAKFDKHFPDLNDKAINLMWELKRPISVPLVLGKLQNAKTPIAQRVRYVDIVANSGDPAAFLELLKLLPNEKSADVREQILISIKNAGAAKVGPLAQKKELEDILESLFKKAETRETALLVVELTARMENLDQVAAIAKDRTASLPVRIQAVRALGAFKSEDATRVLTYIAVTGVEKPNEIPLVLQEQALLAVGRQMTPVAEDVLRMFVVVRKFDTDVPLFLRQAAAAALAGNKSGASWLLDAYGKKQLPAALTPDLARLLRNSPFADIKKQAQKALPAPPKIDPKNLPSIQALLVRKGNVERGKTLFDLTIKNDAACLKCHTVGNTGGRVGPELSVIGSKASRENLLESILYPSRAIADQYATWVVETKGGLAITGIIVEETPQHIVMRDVNVKEYKIPTKDIESRSKSKLSLMPDNLIQYLPEDDLLDIVEYLYSLKSPVLTPGTLSTKK